MNEPSQFDSLDASRKRRSSSLWRRSAGLIVQLAVLALVAMLAGVFIFPL